jgi:hypothetical protein
MGRVIREVFAAGGTSTISHVSHSHLVQASLLPLQDSKAQDVLDAAVFDTLVGILEICSGAPDPGSFCNAICGELQSDRPTGQSVTEAYTTAPSQRSLTALHSSHLLPESSKELQHSINAAAPPPELQQHSSASEMRQHSQHLHASCDADGLAMHSEDIASPSSELRQHRQHLGASCDTDGLMCSRRAVDDASLPFEGFVRVVRCLAELHWAAGRPRQSIKWSTMAAAAVEAGTSSSEEAARSIEHHLCADEGELAARTAGLGPCVCPNMYMHGTRFVGVVVPVNLDCPKFSKLHSMGTSQRS